ncbi:hypothetical protein SNE40_004915 [Patella caerulea]|uniref:SNRNP25 ubiquitin-like domain-containing protein n=1 Tax=Patella caerulea TaxID=87958 RepID=A0AAN8Q1H7_PATCE
MDKQTRDESLDVKAIVKIKQEPFKQLKGKDDVQQSEKLTTDTTLSHKDAMQQVQDILAELIPSDPLLQDLPGQVTLEEVNSMIALEHGQAMVVFVRRDDGISMPIVVIQDATVLDLKQAIKRYVMLKQARSGSTQHISWKYVWRRHWLYYDNQKLSDDKKTLKEYGIRNKAEVTFIKRLKEK